MLSSSVKQAGMSTELMGLGGSVGHSIPPQPTQGVYGPSSALESSEHCSEQLPLLGTLQSSVPSLELRPVPVQLPLT